jgi:hypothetical protein
MPDEATWDDPELDLALIECRHTYRGPGPCYLPDYLMARHKYHAILVRRGMLDPKLAEPNPLTTP